MKAINADELRKLFGHRNGCCISIYMPGHRGYPGQQQDCARFRNLLRQAEEQLAAKGVRSLQIDLLLKPSRELLEEPEFWRRQDFGLAHFIAQDLTQPYRLPFSPLETVTVAEHFHLKPLMRLLIGDGNFYLLAISRNQVRLMEGTRHEFRPVNLNKLPKSLADALRYENPEQQIRYHITGTGSGGRPESMVHGQGIGKDDAKETLLRYFRQIDRGLHDFLHDKRHPLVLAAVEYYWPIYREANTYPFLMDQGIMGNQEHVPDEELHRRAWQIVEPWFCRENDKETERYWRWAGTGLTANDFEHIIPASQQGRVESLIVAIDSPQWGAVLPDENRIELHEREQPGDEDLVDYAAIQTLLHGGKVFAVDPDKVPEHRLAAAVLRY